MTTFVGDGRLAGNGRVLRLTLARNGSELSLSILLQEMESSVRVEVEFDHVSDLKFRGERTELTHLVMLTAEDVSSHGWERVRFVVRDYEEEFISFRCEQIRIARQT